MFISSINSFPKTSFGAYFTTDFAEGKYYNSSNVSSIRPIARDNNYVSLITITSPNGEETSVKCRTAAEIAAERLAALEPTKVVTLDFEGLA